MKHSLFLLSVFGLILIFLSCHEETERSDIDIYNNWEITEFMSVESVLYAKIDAYNPFIKFNREGNYSLKLDRNTCAGNFVISDDNNMEISAPGCTKICCDSDFSNKLAVILSEVESYSIENDEMRLNVSGWGWINLKLNTND